MDSPQKLKIKIGPHEFEAEGPVEIVQQQFAAFKDLVALAASNHSLVDVPPKSEVDGQRESKDTLPPNGISLSKITNVDGRVVSLTVRPDDIYQAILLILFGQKELRQNVGVTGAEVMDGLKNTGGFSVERVDRLLENLAANGEVIVIGEHRAKRYRLTNAGNTKAAQIAERLVSTVP